MSNEDLSKFKMPFPPTISVRELIPNTKRGKKPTKPLNAFMIYRKIFVKEMAKNFRFEQKKISPICGASWRNEPDVVKKVYSDLALEADALFAQSCEESLLQSCEENLFQSCDENLLQSCDENLFQLCEENLFQSCEENLLQLCEENSFQEHEGSPNIEQLLLSTSSSEQYMNDCLKFFDSCHPANSIIDIQRMRSQGENSAIFQTQSSVPNVDNENFPFPLIENDNYNYIYQPLIDHFNNDDFGIDTTMAPLLYESDPAFFFEDPTFFFEDSIYSRNFY